MGRYTCTLPYINRSYASSIKYRLLFFFQSNWIIKYFVKKLPATNYRPNATYTPEESIAFNKVRISGGSRDVQFEL